MKAVSRDAINRRNRYAPPQTTGKRVTPQPRDVEIFRLLDRHGPLPTRYLYHLTKHIARDETGLCKRLCDLYNEHNTPHGGPYLARPAKQFDAYEARYQLLVYDNGANAHQVLETQGFLAKAPRPREQMQFHHRFMVSCLLASIEIACQESGLRFIHEGEILADSPNKHLEIPCAISHTFRTGKTDYYDRPLIPDGIFGIEYADGKRLYFLLEADRDQEPTTRTTFEQTSYLRKLLQYREVVGQGIYKEFFGIDTGMVVLHVTTNAPHMKGIIEVMTEISGGRGSNYQLFKTASDFGDPFRVRGPMTDILTAPWHRAVSPPMYLLTP